MSLSQVIAKLLRTIQPFCFVHFNFIIRKIYQSLKLGILLPKIAERGVIIGKKIFILIRIFIHLLVIILLGERMYYVLFLRRASKLVQIMLLWRLTNSLEY